MSTDYVTFGPLDIELTMWVLGLLGLVAFTFGSRALPRLSLGNLAIHGGDTFFHLIYIDAIRESGAKAYSHLPGCMPHAADSAYPFGLHWLLARFKKSHVVHIERIWGAIVDVLLVLLTVLGGLKLGLDRPTCLIAGLLAATTPMYLSANPLRCFEFNCRAFGELCFALGGLFTFLGSQGSVGLYTVGIVCLAMVFLSSTFGLQAVILLWLPLTLISSDPWLIASTFLAFAFSFVVSGGHFYRVIDSHVRFLINFCLKMQWEHVALKNARMGISGFIGMIRKDPANLAYAMFRLIFGNPYFSTLIRAQIWIVVFIGLASGLGLNSNAVTVGSLSFFKGWSLIPLLLFAIINIRGLRFLGEPQRYLDYAVVPTCWLAASILTNLSIELLVSSLVLLVGLQLAVSLTSIVAFLLLKMKSFDLPEWEETKASLDALDGVRRVLTIPIQYGRRLTYETRHLSDGGAGATTAQSIAGYKLLFDGHYPFATTDLSGVCEKLGYDTILVSKEHVALEANNRNYDFDGAFERVMENRKYALYVRQRGKSSQLENESSMGVLSSQAQFRVADLA